MDLVPDSASQVSNANEPWMEVSASRYLTSWLAENNLSIACSTYQTGKLLMIGRRPDGQASVFERNFARSMGLWGDGQALWLSTQYQIWKLVNVLPPGAMYQDYDRLFVPKVGYTTGDLDVHDIVIESTGRLVFVATQFNCLGTLSDNRSFTPLWRPKFISKLASEDRCHLNGLALEDGKCRYVSAVSTSDIVDGWRDKRHDGGIIMHLPDGEIVARGLSMPHSPRVYRGELWVLNSGEGFFGKIDRATGKFEPVTFCPGYLRGLAFAGDYAIVGLSRPRRDRTFGGLALEQELERRGGQAQCGIQIIDLRTGDVSHWLRFDGMVTELYDVVTLPGVARPTLFGFKTDEIQRNIVADEPGTL